MLAPSKPKSMKTLRAPSMICRLLEESGSPTKRRGDEFSATIGLASQQIWDPGNNSEGYRPYIYQSRIYLDRTVRSMLFVPNVGRGGRLGLCFFIDIGMRIGRAVMAAARDQAARIVRTGPETAGGEAAREASADIADSIRAHLSDETPRRTTEVPDRPAIAKPPAMPAAAETAAAPAAKAGKRKTIFFGAI